MDIAHRPPAGGGGGTAPEGGKGSNRKKRKDPAAPKRASNAYMIFCKERRGQLKSDRPDLPFGTLYTPYPPSKLPVLFISLVLSMLTIAIFYYSVDLD